jgi:hypothetical protein
MAPSRNTTSCTRWRPTTSAALPDRLLLALKRLGDSMEGYKISRLAHSLQSATLAEADGADHRDHCGGVAPRRWRRSRPGEPLPTGSRRAAPYVRAEVTWIVEMHGLFQMQYYAHHYGKNPERLSGLQGPPVV